MTCPVCSSENRDDSETCFTCGESLGSGPPVRKGTVIAARYEILSLLGKGGMGVVYRAHDRVLDEQVALKVLRSEVSQSPDLARRFRSEIKLARRVRHPNVCGIHEYGEDGRLSYIAMEYIDGVDLKQLLRERGPLPAEEAVDVAVQVAEGLQSIHSVGIIHRDLKTANVMRDSLGAIRLMDFGIAKRADSETSATATGLIVGTPEYMSPEQAQSQPLDSRSDIYALGILVFELFTGEVPFRGDTPFATILQHIQQPPPLEGGVADRIPPAVRSVIRKALAKDPDDRYGGADEMAVALKEAVSFRPRPKPVLRVRRGVTAAQKALPDPEAFPTPVPTRVPTVVPTAKFVTPAATAVPIVTVATPIPQERTRLQPQTPRPARNIPAPPRVGRATAARRASPLWLLAVPAAAVAAGGFWLATRNGTPRTGPPAAMTAAESQTPSLPAETAPPAVMAPTTEPPPTTVAAKSVETRLAAGTVSAARPSTVERSVRPSPSARSSPPRPSPSAPPIPAAAQPGLRILTPPPTTASPVPLEAVTDQTGTLQFLIVPWAQVEVDGVKVGTSPPLRPLSLPAGVHSVKLTHPDYVPFPRKVTIRPGETTRLQVDLTKEAFPK